ncbi:hypothetical protein BDW59DRAFT_172360 [Aspergillus cavernicola]|uniref:F-box domain-containing protein n=1 Tax=Aspergillus cavernicola TaxID=176166 RepID=A0ABR4ICN5_9EURO
MESFEVYISSDMEFTRCILCGCPTATRLPVWLDIVRICKLISWDEGESIYWDEGEEEDSPDFPGATYFIFHESCWQLLRQCFGADKIELERLYDILRGIATPKNPAFLLLRDYYPCEALSIMNMLKQAKNPPKVSRKVITQMRDSSNPTDPFRHLPLELRHDIAILLPMRDFLTLRYTSRAMEALFHDNHFWKSQFRKYGDRGFLSYMLEGQLSGQHIDWQRLYQASSRLEAAADTALNVYEVSQWIIDKYRAEEGLQAPPLDFYGRALQHYHNDSCIAGRRIERAKISSSLAQIGISFVTGPITNEQQLKFPRGSYEREPASEITALEFINKNGSSLTIGSRNLGETTYTSKELQEYLHLYYNGRPSTSRRTRWPFDDPGVHVLFDAKSFTGFTVLHEPQGISQLGLLRKRTSRTKGPLTFGFGYGWHWFDMALDRVTEVVATFEGLKLVDLGLRGSGVREPVDGRGL